MQTPVAKSIFAPAPNTTGAPAALKTGLNLIDPKFNEAARMQISAIENA
jgi:hypothetical protein